MKAHNGEKSETIVKTVLLFHQLHTSAILQFNLFPTLVRIWTNTVFFYTNYQTTHFAYFAGQKESVFFIKRRSANA